MRELTVMDAIGYVRQCLDELETNGSSMFGEDMDGASLDVIVARWLPYAVEYVHRNMPVSELDGREATNDEVEIAYSGSIVTIKFLRDMERLLHVKSSDSDHVVTVAVDEDSPEGRMQLNGYVCGTWDAPVLVRMKSNSGMSKPIYRYYSIRKPLPDIRISYIPKQKSGQQVYLVSDNALNHILDYLTGLVLQTYNEQERANMYFAKANN